MYSWTLFSEIAWTLNYGDIKSRYPNITAAIEKLLYFWVDISHRRATNSTGIRANWINCLLYIWKVLLNLHNFPLLNINCSEPYLGPLYRNYIIVQILRCKIPERVLLKGAICKRFSKVSRRWRCAACHLLQVFTWSVTYRMGFVPHFGAVWTPIQTVAEVIM